MKKAAMTLIPSFAIIILACLALIFLSAKILPWSYKCEAEGVTAEISFYENTFEATIIQPNGEKITDDGKYELKNGILTLSSAFDILQRPSTMPNVFLIDGSPYFWYCETGIALFCVTLSLLSIGIIAFVFSLVYCIKHEKDG